MLLLMAEKSNYEMGLTIPRCLQCLGSEGKCNCPYTMTLPVGVDPASISKVERQKYIQRTIEYKQYLSGLLREKKLSEGVAKKLGMTDAEIAEAVKT